VRAALRLSLIFLAFAAIGAGGISPVLRDIDAVDRAVRGTRPSYGPATVSTVPNLSAAGALLWMPGLDEGWDPQGLAVVEDSLLSRLTGRSLPGEPGALPSVSRRSCDRP
jgi:hypothetical protein